MVLWKSFARLTEPSLAHQGRDRRQLAGVFELFSYCDGPYLTPLSATAIPCTDWPAAGIGIHPHPVPARTIRAANRKDLVGILISTAINADQRWLNYPIRRYSFLVAMPIGRSNPLHVGPVLAKRDSPAGIGPFSRRPQTYPGTSARPGPCSPRSRSADHPHRWR
jgi:hypothetical protein